MSRRTTSRRLRAALTVIAITLLTAWSSPPTAPVRPAAAAAPPLAEPSAQPSAEPSHAAAQPSAEPSHPAALPASEPVLLDVPALGLRAGPLLRLGIDPDGALEVPPDARTVGWFGLGPTPGALGPAVLAAHVDYAGVPGAFTALRTLTPGARISVGRADGSTAVFTAYRVDQYPKSAFPTEQVYGDTPGAELRLITCGGTFDGANYRDNVVVYARLSG